MRVALVGPYPLDENGASGGIEAAMSYLAEGLRRFSEIDLHIVTVDFERRWNRSRRRQLHVFSASQSRSQLTLYRSERAWLGRVIRQLQPDVVHTHGTNFYGAATCRLPYPTVFTVHGLLRREAMLAYTGVPRAYRAYRRLKGVFNLAFEAYTLSQARNIIAISPYVEQAVSGKDMHIFPIRNPVPDRFYQIEDRTRSGRLLFIGALQARKGLLNLVDAVHLLRQGGLDVELHIIGKAHSPEYQQVVSDRLHSLGLNGSVVFRGFVTDRELESELAECALLVLPSQEETSPFVVQQAMAAGKAVVATRVGGIPHLVEDGRSGLLVPKEDSQALAAAVATLISNPDLRSRMGQRGRQLAERDYRLASIAEKTVSAYEAVISTATEDGVRTRQRLLAQRRT